MKTKEREWKNGLGRREVEKGREMKGRRKTGRDGREGRRETRLFPALLSFFPLLP